MDRQNGDGGGARLGEVGRGGDYVFVSYARPDAKAAQAVIALFERAGFRVWWDGLIPGGERFGTEISEALEKAAAVVVLWSASSKTSHWVQDEASWARDHQRLVPLSIDGSEPPLGFRQFQCLDISEGGIKAGNPAMQRAINAVSDLAAKGPAGEAPAPAVRDGPLGLDRRTALVAGGTAVIAAGGYAGWRFLLAPQDARANSVAVLPFTNLSGQPGQQYLSDGMAAELRAKLSRNQLLRVVGQASSNAFRDRSESSKAIARKLRVANLLDGNVRAAAGQVRIAVELIDGETGFSKWSNSFDRPMDNLLQLQSEIAEAVSAALSAELGAGDEPRERSGGTSDVAAFDAYLRGKELFESQADEASDRAALAQFVEALRRDSEYAAARAARSRVLSVLANQYAKDAAERRGLYKQAVAEARMAIRSADSFADGYVALGYALFYGSLDVAAAEAPYQKAHDLAGGSADVLGVYALYSARRRRFDRASQVITRAQSLDPLNAGLVKTEGRIRFAAGDHEGAIVAARRALQLNPKLSGAHGDMGNALIMLGRIDEAEAEFGQEKIGLLALPGRAIVAIRRRDPAGAGRAFEELRREEGDNGLYQQAQVLAQWGRKAEALDTLDRALREQDSGLVYLLSDPFLAPLHEEAPFKSLLRKLHFV